MSVVVVTGCSTGISRATALAFARRGDRVYATMRGPERGVELQELIAYEGLDAEILHLDLTNDTSVRDAMNAVFERHGRIDVVVTNAGIGPFAARSPAISPRNEQGQ